MARPKAKSGIRIWRRKRDGIQLIQFAELPGRWITSPEYDRAKALDWAKRNRDSLVAKDDLTIADLCKDFYALDGFWVRRNKDKGRKYGTLHLKNRQAYLDNYFSPAFGNLRPEDINRSEFRREFDNWLLEITSFQNMKKKLVRDRSEISLQRALLE